MANTDCLTYGRPIHYCTTFGGDFGGDEDIVKVLDTKQLQTNSFCAIGRHTLIISNICDVNH